MEKGREHYSAAEFPGFPERVVLELTPLCNLSCPMCPRHHIGTKDGFMSGMLWKKLIDEIAQTSPDTIILPFWRGESLLHPGFKGLIDYALGKKLRIHMCTNGQIMDAGFAGVLSKLEFVTFSVHTPRGFENAKEFLKYRTDGKPVAQVSFVEGEASGRILKELVKDRKLCGFDSVRLYQEHTKDGVFGKSGALVSEPRVFCRKLSDTFVIAYDGTISRCNHIWETDKGINVNGTSIKEAWMSEPMLRIREHYPDPYCGPCDQWTGHTCGESWRVVEGKVEHLVFGAPAHS